MNVSNESHIRALSDADLQGILNNPRTNILEQFFALDELCAREKAELVNGLTFTHILGRLPDNDLRILEKYDSKTSLVGQRELIQELRRRGLRPLVWYYSANQQSQGPVDKEDILNLIAGGTIGDQTYVWREDMADWKPAKELPGLFSDAPKEEQVEASASPPRPTSHSSMQGRPKASGLQILAAILLFISVPLWLIMALVFALDGGYGSDFDDIKPGLSVAIAICSIPSGVGLLLMKKWGYIFSLVTLIIGTLIGVSELFSTYSEEAWIVLIFFELILIALIMSGTKKFQF